MSKPTLYKPKTNDPSDLAGRCSRPFKSASALPVDSSTTSKRSPSYWSVHQNLKANPGNVSPEKRFEAFRRFGNFSLAYSIAVQPRLEYFCVGDGFIAFARRFGLVFVLGDPLCSEADKGSLLEEFLNRHPRSTFIQISESTASQLAHRGFLVNDMGVDTRLDLNSLTFAGKEREWLRYAENWVLRRGYRIEEGSIAERESEVVRVSEAWRKTRTVKRKEVRFLNRPIPMIDEPLVRRFFLFSPENELVAFVFFDPLFSQGQLSGYVTCIKRRSPEGPSYAEAAIMKRAIEVFQSEGVPAVWLGLSPLAKIENKTFAANRLLHWTTRYYHRAAWFNRFFYNFSGHTQFKSRFRGEEVKCYYASEARFNSFRLLTFASISGVF